MLNDSGFLLNILGWVTPGTLWNIPKGVLRCCASPLILLILSVFVHGGGEVAGVAAGLLPRPKLGAAARRGLGSGLGGDRSITTLQAASRGIQHQTDRWTAKPRSGQCDNFGHMWKPNEMIIGNDGNVLNCAGGQRVGVITFLRSGMTWTMLLRKILIFRLRRGF